MGFDTGDSQTPITPVMAGDEATAQELSKGLWDEGVFAPAIVYPTVPRGRARVRTIVTADHDREDLEQAVHAFGRVGDRLGML